jgi:hypothetical protein
MLCTKSCGGPWPAWALSRCIQRPISFALYEYPVSNLPARWRRLWEGFARKWKSYPKEIFDSRIQSFFVGLIKATFTDCYGMKFSAKMTSSLCFSFVWCFQSTEYLFSSMDTTFIHFAVFLFSLVRFRLLWQGIVNSLLEHLPFSFPCKKSKYLASWRKLLLEKLIICWRNQEILRLLWTPISITVFKTALRVWGIC